MCSDDDACNLQLVAMCQDTEADILERLQRQQRHALTLQQKQLQLALETRLIAQQQQDRTNTVRDMESQPSTLPSSPPPSESTLNGIKSPTAQQVSLK